MPSLFPLPASGSGSVSVLSSSAPPPSSGNFSWCEKVYLMANCRLPRRSCLVRCESAVCCIFPQVINMYTLSLSRSGCRPCVLLGPVRVRERGEQMGSGSTASGIAEQLSKQAAFSFLFIRRASPHLASLASPWHNKMFP